MYVDAAVLWDVQIGLRQKLAKGGRYHEIGRKRAERRHTLLRADFFKLPHGDAVGKRKLLHRRGDGRAVPPHGAVGLGKDLQRMPVLNERAEGGQRKFRRTEKGDLHAPASASRSFFSNSGGGSLTSLR